jgi:glycosyltransferase involved in cell wall biosynthesis
MSESVRILYLTAESWPTHRADVSVLFGKYLPQFGINTTLITERTKNNDTTPWSGGSSKIFSTPQNIVMHHMCKTSQLIRTLISFQTKEYDAIQVRDMPIIGLFALLIAKLKGIPYFYWMSFPQSEAQILRANARGPKAGLRYLLPLLQGIVGKWVLYHWVMPHATHNFVQSEQMRIDVTANGIPVEKMTPVPMCVDTEDASISNVTSISDSRLLGKKIAVYLGTFAKPRKIELLFEMLAIAIKSHPTLILLLVGDTEDPHHKAWLESEAERHGISESVIWTGWIPMKTAWQYVRAADVGISIFPRSYLLDSASPTKVVEYLALGIPVLANDNPDQKQIIEATQCGLCVEQTAQEMAQGLTRILSSEVNYQPIAKRGISYIQKYRNYRTISEQLAQSYCNHIKTASVKLNKQRSK